MENKKRRKILFTKTPFGIEIEFSCSNPEDIDLADYPNWYKKLETSVENGIEITGKNPLIGEKATDEIYGICDAIELGKQDIDKDSCGGHVHVSLSNMDSRAIVILSDIYRMTESVIYAICNPPGEKIRLYAEAHARGAKNKINSHIIGFDIDNPKSVASKLRGDKMLQAKSNGIRFANTLGTIEYRMSNEPKNAEDWIDNINLYVGMVEAAKRLSKIYGNGEKDKDYERLRKIGLKEETDEIIEEKLELLLSIIEFPEEYKEVYRTRFRANIENAKDFLNKKCAQR